MSGTKNDMYACMNDMYACMSVCITHAQGMNEIGCTGCSDIANALIASDGNQLQRLQLRLNGIRNDGGVSFLPIRGSGAGIQSTLYLSVLTDNAHGQHRRWHLPRHSVMTTVSSSLSA